MIINCKTTIVLDEQEHSKAVDEARSCRPVEISKEETVPNFKKRLKLLCE